MFQSFFLSQLVTEFTLSLFPGRKQLCHFQGEFSDDTNKTSTVPGMQVVVRFW